MPTTHARDIHLTRASLQEIHHSPKCSMSIIRIIVMYVFISTARRSGSGTAQCNAMQLWWFAAKEQHEWALSLSKAFSGPASTGASKLEITPRIARPSHVPMYLYNIILSIISICSLEPRISQPILIYFFPFFFFFFFAVLGFFLVVFHFEKQRESKYTYLIRRPLVQGRGERSVCS